MRIKYAAWFAGACLFGVVLAFTFAQGEIRAGMSIRAVAQDSVDIDGDDLRYEFRWYRERDGTVAALPEYDTVSEWIAAPYDQTAESVIPPGIIEKGEIWRVEVRACDADECGEYVTAEVTVGGRPPTVPGVSIEPVP